METIQIRLRGLIRKEVEQMGGLLKHLRYLKFLAALFWSASLVLKFDQLLAFLEEKSFINSTNFGPHAFLTLVLPRDYAFNPKTLIKVSKVS